MGGQGTPDERLLIEFVQRLIADQFPGGPTTVTVFVGRFPEAPHVSVPELPEGRLLGTAVHWRMSRVAALEAIIDAPASPARTLTRYEEVLRANGWELAREFGPSGPPGFLTAFVGHWRTYQRVRTGPVLVVNALPRDPEGTDLRLRMEWGMPRQMPPRRDPAVELMPPLIAPPDITLQPRGHGTGDSWTAEASTQSDKPPAELESYFRAQLNASAGRHSMAVSATSLPGAHGVCRGRISGVPFSSWQRLFLASIRFHCASSDRLKHLTAARSGLAAGLVGSKSSRRLVAHRLVSDASAVLRVG